MDQFEKISVSLIIWYLVPGLSLVYFILFPILAFDPHLTILFFNIIGPVGTIILGIILGFFLDGLRLYRLRPKYSKIKKSFFKDLHSIIDPSLDPYFILSHINDLAITKKTTGLSLHHAIWIMLGNFTVLAFIESIFWIFASVYLYYFGPCHYSLFGKSVSSNIGLSWCIVFVFVFLIVSLRFLCISMEDQKNTNNMFSNFAKQYHDEIIKALNL